MNSSSFENLLLYTEGMRSKHSSTYKETNLDHEVSVLALFNIIKFWETRKDNEIKEVSLQCQKDDSGKYLVWDVKSKTCLKDAKAISRDCSQYYGSEGSMGTNYSGNKIVHSCGYDETKKKHIASVFTYTKDKGTITITPLPLEEVSESEKYCAQEVSSHNYLLCWSGVHNCADVSAVETTDCSKGGVYQKYPQRCTGFETPGVKAYVYFKDQISSQKKNSIITMGVCTGATQ